MIPETKYSEHLPSIVLSADTVVVADENNRLPEIPDQFLAELQSLDEDQDTALMNGLVDFDDILKDLMEGLDDDFLDSLAWTPIGAEFDMFSYIDPDFKGHHILDCSNNIMEDATEICQVI